MDPARGLNRRPIPDTPHASVKPGERDHLQVAEARGGVRRPGAGHRARHGLRRRRHLTSVSLTLPTSDRDDPAGPHAETIDDDCLSCHSAGMVPTRPRLSRTEWQGEVAKMASVYKAPIAPADVKLIVDDLAALTPGR